MKRPSILLLSLLGTAAASLPRGVGPEDAARYAEAATFKCSGQEIPWAAVNDDYCDCDDGSDEPGTSACSRTKPVTLFWCENKGHKGENIAQSRINDGICDCCDGSDEYSTGVGCEDICVEVATVRAREQAELAKKTAAGLAHKKELVNKAKQLIAEKKASLQTKQEEIDATAPELEEAKKVLQEEEAKEKEERDAIKHRSEEKKKEWEADKERRDAELQEKEAQLENELKAAVAEHGELVEKGKGELLQEVELLNGKKFDQGTPVLVVGKEPESGLLLVQIESDPLSVFPAEKLDVKPIAKQVPEDDQLDSEGNVLPTGEPLCKRWVQTSSCDPEGKVEDSRTCDTVVKRGSSGYCECADNGKHTFNCDHDEFTCQHVCEAEGAMSTTLKYSCPNEFPFPADVNTENKHNICYKNQESADVGSGPCGSWCARDPEWFEANKCTWGCECGDLCEKGPVHTPEHTMKRLMKDEPFVIDTGASHYREEASQARRIEAEIRNKREGLEKELGQVKADLAANYGPDHEFLPLKGQCFDYKTPEYVYKLCPFDEIKQGGTSLGKWESWGQQTYGAWGGSDDLNIMKYDKGQKCWSGPMRSTEVKVLCGPENIVRSVDEPSMCTYVMVWETPAACSE